MTYGVFVRRPGNYHDPLPRLLATDISDEGTARRLAGRLANSYSCHGRHQTTGVFWFRDDEGLAEIWAQRR